ncbi:hypothetical protein DB88DRAFT_321769 [Papiliotrema laurentii]|uniref:Uncharacterized protein n=1 Tax=Papiliotrema laurentii TaxID=5418 RepID=A0AAD9D171_PAPLA|nr:hypothetical protein DB88DRAFT_321769 [Papiliotrema laurentii]
MFAASGPTGLKALHGNILNEAEHAMSTDTDFRTCATFGSARSPTSDPDLHSLSRMTSSGIRIVPGPAQHPPQAHLISLKTRIAPLAQAQDLSKVNHVEEVYAGLLFGQIPNLCLARHQGGTFAPDIQRFHLGAGALSDLDVKYDQVVRRVRHVLGWLVNITRNHRKVGFVGHCGRITAFVLEKEVDQLSIEAWKTLHQSGACSRRRDVVT